MHQLIPARAVIGPQRVDIAQAAGGVADGVQQDGGIHDPRRLQYEPRQLDDLGVHRRVSVAYHLDAELVELPVTPRLRPVVAKEASLIVPPDGLRQVVHAVLEVRAAHGRRALGAQGDQVSPSVLEGVGLFLDDVRDLTDAPYEEIGVLEGGGIDPFIPEPGRDIFGPGLEITPVALLLGQHVGGASRCLKRIWAHVFCMSVLIWCAALC